MNNKKRKRPPKKGKALVHQILWDIDRELAERSRVRAEIAGNIRASKEKT